MCASCDDSAPTALSDPTALLVAWVGRRLDATTDWLLDEARLYGVTVRDDALLAADDDGAARFCLLDRGYPYDIVEGPAGLLAGNFDAVALLTLGWQAPTPPDEAFVRPSRHPHRERVRVVSLVRMDPDPACATIASSVRVQGKEPLVYTDGTGRMVDALTNLAAEVMAGELASGNVTQGTPGTS